VTLIVLWFFTWLLLQFGFDAVVQMVIKVVALILGVIIEGYLYVGSGHPIHVLR
jgi:hypothetical protein